MSALLLVPIRSLSQGLADGKTREQIITKRRAVVLLRLYPPLSLLKCGTPLPLYLHHNSNGRLGGGRMTGSGSPSEVHD